MLPRFLIPGVLALALSPSIAGAVTVTVYDESGDAGGSFATAQSIVGTVNAVAGSIGNEDFADFFKFHWNGGAMGLELQCTDPQCGTLAIIDPIARVFRDNPSHTFVGSAFYTDTPGSGLHFFGTPAAGDYFLQVEADIADPPYTAVFFTFNS